MNHIPEAADLPKGMAHYWFELDNNNKHNYFLFCQTSDKRIHHATKSQLMKFLESKSTGLLLKPWHSIEGKRKRKIKKEKAKQQQLEEEPKKKKRKVIVLPAPPLPVLSPEILVMILHYLSEPTPDNRRVIFSFLKGPRSNAFSDELTSSKLIWEWYRKVLDRKPPKRILQLGQYYIQRGEYKTFARRWYANFVHFYDISQLAPVAEFFEDDSTRKIMQKQLTPVAMKILMMNLRGRILGQGRHKDSGFEYELVEIEIQAALDVSRQIPYSGHVIPDFMKRPLQYAMITVIEGKGKNDSIKPKLLRKSWWYDDHGLRWLEPVWFDSETKKLKNIRINNIFALSEYLVKVMRGLDRGQKFTVRDLTAYAWLNQVLIKLYYMPLGKAMIVDSFPDDIRLFLTEEMRIIKMSKQEKEAEDKLSFQKQEEGYDKRYDDYFDNLFNTKGVWADRWRLQESKRTIKEKESNRTYNEEKNFVIQAYQTAASRAEKFIAREIKLKIENTTTTTALEIAMNEFRGELMGLLVQMFKLTKLWNEVSNFGKPTIQILGTSPGTVYRDGIASIQQIIRHNRMKQKTEEEEEMSSSNSGKFKGKEEEEEEEEEESEWWNDDEDETERDEKELYEDDDSMETIDTQFWN